MVRSETHFDGGCTVHFFAARGRGAAGHGNMPAVAHTPAESGRMVVRMLDAAAREEAQRLWAAREQLLGGAPALSCSWIWTSTWLEHYGDAVAHRFAVGERDGEPLALALISQQPARPPRPRAWHLGTAGEPAGTGVFVERNRLLVAPGERAAFAAALLGAVGGERGWDRLRLDGLHADDAADLIAALPGASVTVEQSPIADLQAGDDVLAALSGSRRQRIRRTLRAFGELEADWAETAEEALATLDELIDLHQRRWGEVGEPGAFAQPRFAAFHRALIARLVPRGQAALVRVRRGAETVGCLYGLIDGQRLCFYQGGLQSYDDNRLRAGVAAHVTFMQACRERGLTEYDFLAPAARYKDELASRADELTWIELTRPRNWRMRLSDTTRALRARR